MEVFNTVLNLVGFVLMLAMLGGIGFVIFHGTVWLVLVFTAIAGTVCTVVDQAFKTNLVDALFKNSTRVYTGAILFYGALIAACVTSYLQVFGYFMYALLAVSLLAFLIIVMRQIFGAIHGDRRSTNNSSRRWASESFSVYGGFLSSRLRDPHMWNLAGYILAVNSLPYGVALLLIVHVIAFGNWPHAKQRNRFIRTVYTACLFMLLTYLAANSIVALVVALALIGLFLLKCVRDRSVGNKPSAHAEHVKEQSASTKDSRSGAKGGFANFWQAAKSKRPNFFKPNSQDVLRQSKAFGDKIRDDFVDKVNSWPANDSKILTEEAPKSEKLADKVDISRPKFSPISEAPRMASDVPFSEKKSSAKAEKAVAPPARDQFDKEPSHKEAVPPVSGAPFSGSKPPSSSVPPKGEAPAKAGVPHMGGTEATGGTQPKGAAPANNGAAQAGVTPPFGDNSRQRMSDNSETYDEGGKDASIKSGKIRDYAQKVRRMFVKERPTMLTSPYHSLTDPVRFDLPAAKLHPLAFKYWMSENNNNK